MLSRVGSSSYDVFINFRGEDTRNPFVGHLYSALKDRGLHAFIDSKDLWKGEDIGELLEAIKGSKLSIAVFSERYVESKWCLQELTQMLECHRTNGQIIFPIFFKVKTSDVKNQAGCFEISPQMYSTEAPETLQRWKDALQVVGDKSGWVFNDGDQSELVSSIVQQVWIRLNKVPLINVKNPIGLEFHVQSVLSFLSDTDSKDVQFLGIRGLGGIGKTTIATSVYNHIFRNFSKSCFLENIREKASQPNGIVNLQKILFERIFGEEIKISGSREGSSLIKERLGKTDTLLILDDVSQHTQLEALAGDLNWLGPRSRIIITTRDQSISRGVFENNKKIYEPKELNEEESLQLFSSYAFLMDQPPEDYMQLSVDLVRTTGGLPLALVVLGSDLSINKDKEVWESMLRKLKQIPHNDVYVKLKTSYDDLQDDIERDMFLDAACFFIGWKKEAVISIWEACGFEARYYFEGLMRKSLLKINEVEELWMNDQIRDMGRRIVYNQRPMKPGRHSRLWSRDDIMKVLNVDKGNEMVEGIVFRCSSNDTICLLTKGFEKMPKLRLLQIDGATLNGSFQCLPHELRWLSWQNCPFEELPADFYHEELVMLELCNGSFRQVWNNWPENKFFQQLKVLKLSSCRSLSMSPDFSGFPKLERLYLDNCDSLVTLHGSIEKLQKLVYLNLESCRSLKVLPNSICRLSSLQKLILSHCISLNKLPKSIGDLKESLTELLLNDTNIRALPNGVGLLKKLEVLDLSLCHKLVNLPRSIENMTSLCHIELCGRNELILTKLAQHEKAVSVKILQKFLFPLLCYHTEATAGLSNICSVVDVHEDSHVYLSHRILEDIDHLLQMVHIQVQRGAVRPLIKMLQSPDGKSQIYNNGKTDFTRETQIQQPMKVNSNPNLRSPSLPETTARSANCPMLEKPPPPEGFRWKQKGWIDSVSSSLCEEGEDEVKANQFHTRIEFLYKFTHTCISVSVTVIFMEPKVGSSSYDVFINFRGEDTRNTFVGHLYRALKNLGIHAFIDSKDLWKGEDIGPELLGAIKGSKLSIVVFSERYVESNWCLRELAQMLECHRFDGQIILPIFFKVRTSDVKNQTGCFEISPQRQGEKSPETLQRWKDSLQAIGDKSGWVFDNGDQSELVSSVVQSAWIRLNMVPLIGVKHPVGLESRIDSVLSLLIKPNSTDVLFLGICGLGGIGKTTIATAVYNCIFKNFSKSCFLEDIREQASQPNGIVCLQEKLLYNIFRQEIKICSSREGSRLIKERLQKIDTLIILDDVNDRIQLNALVGDLNWFGPGSRIIITTRDQGVLSGVPENIKKIYEPKELNEKQSLQLFSSNAFSTDQPPDDYMQLSVDIVRTAGGLPLTLEVLGSDLSIKKDKEVWKSMHRILKQIPHNDVYGKLKVSYDNLQDDIEKAMFLDAACFFVGWEEETVISIWEACGFEPKYRLEVLNRKSLLKISESKELWMHDQIRDMGKGIVYKQSPMEPDKLSRLWSHDVILKVLNGGKGNEMVEGLLLSFNSNDNACLQTEVFEKMPKLRLLQVDGATLEGSFQCLPSGLRWLKWWKCPLQNLSPDFYHDELVMLDLRYGLFRKAWNNWLENKIFQQLKVLKLSCCFFLSESPDLSGVPGLERLYLDNCAYLINLDESIGQLQQLVYLNLGYCYSLKKLPNSVCRLSSLHKLILTHCISLNELPGSIGDLKESLVELSLDRTNIKALPDSFGLLKKLEVLDLSLCHGLVYLPRSLENMMSLRYIDLSGRDKLPYIPILPSSLIELRFLCKSLVSLPNMRNLKKLELLCLKDICIKAEPFRGFMRTIHSDYKEVDQRFIITNHSQQPTHGQRTGFRLGNHEGWRQIWIVLQNTYEGPSPYLTPDFMICSRLLMHISLCLLISEEILLENVPVNIILNFQACIHRNDKKTYCETRLRIEGIKLMNQEYIEYIHEFEGFDWFGFPLEGRDIIEISQVDPVAVDECVQVCMIGCTVNQLNLLLIKEEPNLDMLHSHFSACDYGKRYLEFVRY
ncbi:uncharacterized protein LOC122667477 [Telopea speciosissima]|uniref:uncharacterized protein LOC122667477 n=1 Tax=Telopea speciosissima TaxID=54955 RepID=UPI001CC823EA|nr:uncharacterized protein LOC122667477 [Telopea speciosissima]